MQDLPENHFRVSRTSWLNTTNEIFVFDIMKSSSSTNFNQVLFWLIKLDQPNRPKNGLLLTEHTHTHTQDSTEQRKIHDLPQNLANSQENCHSAAPSRSYDSRKKMRNSPTLSSPMVIVSESTGSLLVFSSLTVPFMLANKVFSYICLAKQKRELQPCYFSSST